VNLVVKFDEQGNLTFASSSMERQWNRLKRFNLESGSYFHIKIVVDPEKDSTEKQRKLFDRICFMVEEDTGQDFASVRKEFLKLTPEVTEKTLLGELFLKNKALDELSTKEFQDFLEKVLQQANEIMGCKYNLHHDEKFGTLLTREE